MLVASGDRPRGWARAVRRCLMAIAMAGVFWPPDAWAEYLLSPGDVLEISAAGVPELRQRTTINGDGEASFPLLGQIKAANMTISDLRAHVQGLLPTKVFRRREPDGREVAVLVSPDEIHVAVAEYCPVFLPGAAAKPGSQAYLPGLTIRQAVSLAGGYDVMRFRMNNPFLE